MANNVTVSYLSAVSIENARPATSYSLFSMIFALAGGFGGWHLTRGSAITAGAYTDARLTSTRPRCPVRIARATNISEVNCNTCVVAKTMWLL